VRITRRFKILRAVTSEDYWLMEYGSRSVVNIYQHFRGTCCLLHQGVKMDGAGFFETSVSIYQTAQCQISEERSLHCENFLCES
jgi:hypothetical protein